MLVHKANISQFPSVKAPLRTGWEKNMEMETLRLASRRITRQTGRQGRWIVDVQALEAIHLWPSCLRAPSWSQCILQQAGEIPAPTGPQGHETTGQQCHRSRNIAASPSNSCIQQAMGNTTAPALGRNCSAAPEMGAAKGGIFSSFQGASGHRGYSNLEAARQAGHG